MAQENVFGRAEHSVLNELWIQGQSQITLGLGLYILLLGVCLHPVLLLPRILGLSWSCYFAVFFSTS